MNNIYLTPSFYAHIINGLLLFISLIIFYKNYNKISNLEPYKLILLTFKNHSYHLLHHLHHLLR